MQSTPRHRELSTRLDNAARRYAALHERLAAALQHAQLDSSQPTLAPGAPTTLGDQLGAFSRLQSLLEQLESRALAVGASIRLRQTQAARLERVIQHLEREQQKVGQLQQTWHTWVLQEQKASWIQSAIERRMQQRLSELQSNQLGESEHQELAHLRGTRRLLAGCAEHMRAGRQDELRDTLLEIQRLVDDIEEREALLKDKPRRASRANQRQLGQTRHPEDDARQTLHAMRVRSDEARARCGQAAFAAWSTDAELLGLRRRLDWVRGELDGARRAQQIQKDLRAQQNAREAELLQVKEAAEDAVVEAQGELAGRQQQLAWLIGELEGRHRFHERGNGTAAGTMRPASAAATDDEMLEMDVVNA